MGRCWGDAPLIAKYPDAATTDCATRAPSGGYAAIDYSLANSRHSGRSLPAAQSFYLRNYFRICEESAVGGAQAYQLQADVSGESRGRMGTRRCPLPSICSPLSSLSTNVVARALARAHTHISTIAKICIVALEGRKTLYYVEDHLLTHRNTYLHKLVQTDAGESTTDARQLKKNCVRECARPLGGSSFKGSAK